MQRGHAFDLRDAALRQRGRARDAHAGFAEGHDAAMLGGVGAAPGVPSCRSRDRNAFALPLATSRSLWSTPFERASYARLDPGVSRSDKADETDPADGNQRQATGCTLRRTSNINKILRTLPLPRLLISRNFLRDYPYPLLLARQHARLEVGVKEAFCSETPAPGPDPHARDRVVEPQCPRASLRMPNSRLFAE